MKESILNIQLSKWPLIEEWNGKNNSNCSNFNFQTKGVKIIKSWSVGEALSYQTSFISINGAIGFVFKFIHPFTSNDISMSRRWDKLSSIILQKSSVFILHGKNPMRADLWKLVWR